MVMFVETTGELQINVDHIKHFTHLPSGKAEVVMCDGDRHFVYDLLDTLRDEVPPMVVAANPGFQVLTYWPGSEGDDDYVARNPVVAWRVDRHRATPVMVDTLDAAWAVVYPDGRVVAEDGIAYENETSWIGALKRHRTQAKVK